MLDFNNAPPQGRPLEEAAAKKARIRLAIRRDPVRFVRSLFPKARIRGTEARIGSTEGERGESLSIELAGENCLLWQDFNTGEAGDEFTLFARARGFRPETEFARILTELDDWYGEGRLANVSTFQRDAAAGTAHSSDEEQLTLQATYCYLKSDGTTTGFEVLRFKTADGGKTYRPRTDGQYRAPDADRPLYGQDRWHDRDSVVIVEGEKCADALHSIGVPATTAPGGAGAYTQLHKVDISLLEGRRIQLWPDNDEPGRRLMCAWSAFLRTRGFTVALLEPPTGKPLKWDAADAVEEGFDVRGFLTAPAASDHGFRGEWLKDISHHAVPELVEGLLPATGLGFLYGPSSGGKSFVAISWALLIASAQPVLDLPTLPSGVLYIAAEGHAGLRKRLVAARRHLNLDDVEIPFNYLPAFINLGSPDSREVDRVLQYARECSGEMRRLGAPLRLIIIDTMAAAAPGVDELTGKDMGPLIARFQHLAVELDCLVMPVAHTGKDESKGLRGWSGSRAAADVAIECRVEREDEDDRESPVRRRYVWFEKAKDGPCGFTLADYHLTAVEVGAKPSGQPDTTCIVEYSAPAAPSPAAVAEEVEREARERLAGLRRAALDGIAASLDDGWMAARETAVRLKEKAGLQIGRGRLVDILKSFASPRQQDLESIAHAGVTIEVQTHRHGERMTLQFRVIRDA